MRPIQATLIDAPAAGIKVLTLRCPPGTEPGRLRFRWPASVRRIWRRPVIQAVSEWAAKNRIMEPERPRPGPWRNEFAWYGRGVMDVFFLPYLRLIVIIAPPQTIKTEIMLNCLGAAMDQAPGPALMAYEQQETAKAMCTTRIRSMMEFSPPLRRLLTGKTDDLNNYEITLRHTHIACAWATSVPKLANKSFRYVFMDEVDKWENTSEREAGPVARAKLRTRAYRHTHKIMEASSPTTEEGEISIEMSRVQARFEYAVVCPDCGAAHVMLFSGPVVDGVRTGVIWPEGERDANEIQSKSLARYVCPHCVNVKGAWDDYKRDRAVRLGHWQEKKTQLELMAYMNRHRPRSVGFHYSALISPLVSLSETAGMFVLAQQELKTGRIDPYKNWLNGYMAETWKEDFSPRKTEAILALRDERPAGVLPDTRKIALLLALVDTQDDGFWYEIRAFGYGQEMESWQIRQGFLDAPNDFTPLDKVLWMPYVGPDGKELYVSMAFIDSQGHRTKEVYEWSIANRGRVMPTKGEQTMKQPYRPSRIEYWPGTDRKMPGGLTLLLVNTKYYKDYLHKKLSIAPSDPGAWHMNSECTEEWAEHMCAEYADERGIWVCPKHKPNHGFDVSVLGICGADYLGSRFMSPDAEEEEETPAPPPRRHTRMW